MGSYCDMIDSAQHWFEKEWRAALQSDTCDISYQNLAACNCICERLVPQLVLLIEEMHETPLSDLEPTIQQMVLELRFIQDGASPTEQELSQSQQVAILMKVLGRVRENLIAHGQWSDAPVTPIMFG